MADLPDYSDTEERATSRQSYQTELPPWPELHTQREAEEGNLSLNIAEEAEEYSVTEYATFKANSTAGNGETESVAHVSSSAAPVQGDLVDHQLLEWSDKSKGWKPYAYKAAEKAPDGRIGDARIITYNVWFNETTGRSLRHRALFKLCVTSKREVDVICLQEMTQEAYDELVGASLFDSDDPLRAMADRCSKLLKKHWLVTDFLPQSLIFKQNIWFGTCILIKRSFAERIADVMRVRSLALPSACNRRLHYIELERHGHTMLRIATFHLDASPVAVDTRRAQLAETAKHICLDGVPSIICGDSNIVTFDELSGITSSPYYLIDAMEVKDPDTPTWNTTYPSKNGNTARVDLVLLSPGFVVEDGENLGFKPFRLPDGVLKPSLLGLGKKLYPSDHLGVFVHARYLKDGG